MAAPKSFWIFQYTNGDRTGGLLEEVQNQKSNDVVNWLWGSNLNQQPIPGDFVFFLRSGAKPKDRATDQNWRGIVGFGVVEGHPVQLENAKRDEGIPVKTLAYFPDKVLPDFLIWHDHRVASAASLFGQQGTNFLIDREVAVALADELDTPEDGISRVDAMNFSDLRELLQDRHRIDGVTRSMDKEGFWVDRDAALALQFARAISATSNRRSDELTWTHLFLGILLRAKGLRKDTRTNVAARALFQLAAPNNDLSAIENYWENRGTPITGLKRSNAGPIEKMSTSAGGSFTQAKKSSESFKEEPISMDALLSGLLNIHREDEIYKELFQADRNVLVERIAEQAAANSRSEELEKFLVWMGHVHINKNPNWKSSGSSTGSQPHEDSGQQSEEADGPNEDPGPRIETDSNDVRAELVTQIPNALNDSADRGRDLLNVGEEAKAFARLIASKSFEPPLAIGVFGPWGSGKTFFMNQIEQAVSNLVNPKYKGSGDQSLQEESSFHDKIVRVPFNAWHYMESNVWASLVDVIFKGLDAWLRDENGGSKKGDEIDALFDSLTTAQEERLNAIEVLAERVKAHERARNDLSNVKKRTKEYWVTVLNELKRNAFTDEKIKSALETLGLHQLKDETGNLQTAISEARKTISDADLLLKSVRARVSSPLSLVGLGAAILLGPFLIGWFINFAETSGWFGLASNFKLDETITTITGLATSAVAWLGAVTGRAKSGVNALRELQAKFDEIDAKAATPLADLETDIDDAKALIVQAEEAVAEAQTRLMQNTSAGRVAAFIRERAESDVYSKHLGIIDTIRRDFEQLSALVENSKTGRDEDHILEQHQNHVAAQIDAIKTRYKLDDDNDDAYAPVREALDKLTETNKTGIQLGTTFDRIVLYIDDLDRCPPNKVYEVLQAVHLFLTFPLFVVVVGVDTRWMETSLKEELGKLVDGTSGANPKDYLEKIFQIPYWTRRMEGPIAKEFVKGIVPEPSPSTEPPTDTTEGTVVTRSESTSHSEGHSLTTAELGDETMDVFEPEEPVDDDQGGSRIAVRPVVITKKERAILEEFAPFAGRSPRKLLRFVNVYGLIKSVDKEDGSPLVDHEEDEFAFRALIAQLALATGEPEAAVHHFDLIEKSDDPSGYFKDTISSEPDIQPAVPSEISDLIWEPLSLAHRPGRALDFAYEDLYMKLKLTASVARRYTFASSDAVQTNGNDGSAQPSNSKE